MSLERSARATHSEWMDENPCFVLFELIGAPISVPSASAKLLINSNSRTVHLRAKCKFIQEGAQAVTMEKRRSSFEVCFLVESFVRRACEDSKCNVACARG